MSGEVRRKLSDKEAIALAKSFGSRIALRGKDEALYKRINGMGILESLFASDGVVRWNYDKVKAESKKYDGRYSFRKGAKGAYKYASRHDLLDELFPVDKAVKP